jgi:hypothetical protein
MEEIAEHTGFPQPVVDGLIADFCQTIDWK